jgi:anti-sigma factor RsiW
MVHEDLEFLISQYIDGTISPDDRVALEARLATDVEARELVREYRKLEGLIQANVPPVPEVDYDALTSRINDAIDEQQAERTRRFRIPWIGGGIGLALAASVMIVIGTWMRTATPTKTGPGQLAAGKAVAEVAVVFPEVSISPGPAVQVVEISGPAGGGSASIAISEAIVHQSNTLFIAKADTPAQDTSRILY